MHFVNSPQLSFDAKIEGMYFLYSFLDTEESTHNGFHSDRISFIFSSIFVNGSMDKKRQQNTLSIMKDTLWARERSGRIRWIKKHIKIHYNSNNMKYLTSVFFYYH